MYFIAILYSSVCYTISDIHKGLINKNNTTRFKLPLKKTVTLVKAEIPILKRGIIDSIYNTLSQRRRKF